MAHRCHRPRAVRSVGRQRRQQPLREGRDGDGVLHQHRLDLRVGRTRGAQRPHKVAVRPASMRRPIACWSHLAPSAQQCSVPPSAGCSVRRGDGPAVDAHHQTLVGVARHVGNVQTDLGDAPVHGGAQDVAGGLAGPAARARWAASQLSALAQSVGHGFDLRTAHLIRLLQRRHIGPPVGLQDADDAARRPHFVNVHQQSRICQSMPPRLEWTAPQHSSVPVLPTPASPTFVHGALVRVHAGGRHRRDPAPLRLVVQLHRHNVAVDCGPLRRARWVRLGLARRDAAGRQIAQTKAARRTGAVAVGGPCNEDIVAVVRAHHVGFLLGVAPAHAQAAAARGNAGA